MPDNRKMTNQHLCNLLAMCDDELSREAGKRLQMAVDALWKINDLHDTSGAHGISGSCLYDMEYE